MRSHRSIPVARVAGDAVENEPATLGENRSAGLVVMAIYASASADLDAGDVGEDAVLRELAGECVGGLAGPDEHGKEHRELLRFAESAGIFTGVQRRVLGAIRRAAREPGR